LPSTGGASNWHAYTVDDNVPLKAGVQIMRVFIGGDSPAFNLDQINVSYNPPSENYTKGSYYLYQKEVERIEAEMNQPDDNTDLAAKFVEAEAVLLPLADLPVDKVQVQQSMVTASSISWDNKLNAALNGWQAFDGNAGTSPDTKSGDGWVRVDLGAGNERAIGKVRFYGRAGNVARMNGALIQGSNDGTNFVTLHTIGGISELDWYTVLLNSDTAYRYLRYYTPGSGHANVGELEFYKKENDKSLLAVKLQEAGAAETGFYSQAGAAALQAEISNAQSVYDDANATQKEIDAATESLVAAATAIPVQ
jgi:hypothetical protein